MRLYEIANTYQKLLDQTFDQETGEVNDLVMQELENITDDMNKKGIAIASFIKNMDADEKAIDAAIDAMKRRRDQLERKQSYLKEYLLFNMERCGIKEISCPYFQIRVKKNPVSVSIDNEDEIPDEYKKVKQTIAIDKLKLKEELAQGVVVQGAKLTQSLRLEIK